MTPKKLRWGILSTAEIARKNWQAIRLSGNAVVTAVASREGKRSRQFIAECQAHCPMPTPPQALGSYEALLASKDVDAVYIPLPTGLRKEWVLRAAVAGKHIVCEKPCANNAADLREMLAACRRQRVQFMDGVMFMHSRRLDALREVLDDGASVGRLRRLSLGFSFWAPPAFFAENIRAHSGLEPHGCLGDLGWYCLRFALWAMKEQLPRAVTGRTLAEAGRPDSPAKVPAEFSGELFFDGGVSAGYYCSFLTGNQQWAVASGTKGYVQVRDFVLPFFGHEAAFDVTNSAYQITGCDFHMEPGRRRVAVAEYSNSHPSAQETNLFRTFSAQALSGRLNKSWPAIALRTQLVMEACLASAREDGRLVSL